MPMSGAGASRAARGSGWLAWRSTGPEMDQPTINLLTTNHFPESFPAMALPEGGTLSAGPSNPGET